MTGAFGHGTVGGASYTLQFSPTRSMETWPILPSLCLRSFKVTEFIRHLDRTTAGDDTGTTVVGLRVLRIRAAPAKAVLCVAIQVGIIEGAFQKFLTESVLDLRDVVIDLIA